MPVPSLPPHWAWVSTCVWYKSPAIYMTSCSIHVVMGDCSVCGHLWLMTNATLYCDFQLPHFCSLSTGSPLPGIPVLRWRVAHVSRGTHTHTHTHTHTYYTPSSEEHLASSHGQLTDVTPTPFSYFSNTHTYTHTYTQCHCVVLNVIQ
jgi:hypothetical protein